MKETIIGVDYTDGFISDNFYKVEITVVKGIIPISYRSLLTKDFEEVFTELVLLSMKYNAKINYENNLNRIYSIFSSYNTTYMLRDNSIVDSIMPCNGNEKKGFTQTKRLRDLFEKYSQLLTYNKDFEESYRIAVIPTLSDKTFQYKIKEIECLERKLKELRESL